MHEQRNFVYGKILLISRESHTFNTQLFNPLKAGLPAEGQVNVIYFNCTQVFLAVDTSVYYFIM